MRILVTGATGNIGRMVVQHLVEAGGATVRALTVDPERVALPAGVEVAVGSVRRPDTLPAALEGVDRVYLAPAPGTVVEVMARIRDAGVGHVVDLSGEHESWWGSVATAVEAAGLPWTHLSPGDFMENTESWSEQIRRTGTVREPHPDGASAPIAMDDIAAVAAAVLVAGPESYGGLALPLTGPETLTRLELLERIAEALGRPLEFVQASCAETIVALEPAMGANTAWYVENVLEGYNASAVPALLTVEQVTGRPATTFAAWARANVGKFR